ncbi:Clp protease N-terminal domain-containing protein [Streptomyces lusitanus]|uniref:Clp protease N-terminal domain-containing protein n=1 Tax=Streptomyces lusitanus TaxID=68232 RepID=A0ABU3K1S4_9ACTN|nr:Clp protease N-terminal domain-containing protein [Streptomyces lusitanus]
MRSRIPRQQTQWPQAQAARGPDDDAGLGAELAEVVAGARRRVVRGGDRHIDTAHLLHSLLESDPEVRAAFGDGATVARLLGYLVQRSIGYGLRWQGSVEDSGGLPVVEGAAEFSPLAAACVTRARERAARRGDTAVRGTDLLASLVADPQARAVEVVRRAGVEPHDVISGVEQGAAG